MLLGKKTKYSVESEWAVILDRSVNEFSKNRAVDKLTELFSLSADEAKDLIDNTPLILFDHLPSAVAEKIKGQLSQASVDCSLTNDTFTKRKCFRAIWPEQPDLGRFLEEPSSSLNGDFEKPAQASTESPTPIQMASPEFTPIRSYHGPSQEEQKQLKELTLDLQKENEILRHELEKVEESIKERERKQLNGEIEKLRDERSQLEETLVRLRNENTGLTSRMEELERNMRMFKQSGAGELDPTIKSHITELRTQLEHFRTEYLRAQNTIRLTQGEAKQFQAEWTQTQKTLSEARTEIEDLKRMLNEAQANSVQLKEEVERIRFDARNRFQEQVAEFEEWKRKANDWSASYFKVVKENEFLRAHQSEELESLRVRNQQLTGQLEQAQKQIRDFVAQAEQQELIQKRMKAAQELADEEAHLKGLVQKQQTLETEIRLREEEMKKVLGEQEVVEREIVNAKQAQKYLLEQAKMKDKTRFVRPKGTGLSLPSTQQEPGAIPPAAD